MMKEIWLWGAGRVMFTLEEDANKILIVTTDYIAMAVKPVLMGVAFREVL